MLLKTKATPSVGFKIKKSRLRVVALQEIRWTDSGTIDIQDTKIVYGKCNNQRLSE